MERSFAREVELLKLGEGQPCVGDSKSDGALPTGVSLDIAPTAEGAYCNRATGVVCKAGTCAKAIAAGQPCARDGDCAAGAFCSFSTQTCETLHADGAACVGEVQCASGNCEVGRNTCTTKPLDFIEMLACGK